MVSIPVHVASEVFHGIPHDIHRYVVPPGPKTVCILHFAVDFAPNHELTSVPGTEAPSLPQ